MTNTKEQKITKEELLTLVPAEKLELIEHNVHCGKCGMTTIVGYEDAIFKNDLGDTILRGKCAKCGGVVGRYLETGELEKR